MQLVSATRLATTDAIAAQAVTNADLVNNDATVFNLTTAFQQVAALNFTVATAQSKVLIWTWGFIPNDGTGDTYEVRLLRGAVELKRFGPSASGIYNFHEKETPGAGTFTYAVEARNASGQNRGQFKFSRLMLLETKR
ncbi:MAG TPA: hypothetical protein VNJ53_07775 [Gaiellaceae bacterium]|nr:hypothetical protein [Gaiellaceae bacterium]